MDVKCPHCDQEYTIDESMLGVDLHCQVCGGVMRFELPEISTSASIPPVPPIGEPQGLVEGDESASAEEVESALPVTEITEQESYTDTGSAEVAGEGAPVGLLGAGMGLNSQKPEASIRSVRSGSRANKPKKRNRKKAFTVSPFLVLAFLALIVAGVFLANKKGWISGAPKEFLDHLVEGMRLSEEAEKGQVEAVKTEENKPKEVNVGSINFLDGLTSSQGADATESDKVVEESKTFEVPSLPKVLEVVRPDSVDADLRSISLNGHLSGEELKIAFDEVLTPYFVEHCLFCHGPDEEEGDLRVDKITMSMADDYTAFNMQNIIDEITLNSMPPKDEPRPEGEESVAAIEVMVSIIENAKQTVSGATNRPLRRITRTEFINMAQDYYGVELEPEGLPDDLLVGTFEGDIETVEITDQHIESYVKKSREIVREFIKNRNNPEYPKSYDFFKEFVKDGDDIPDYKSSGILGKFAVFAKRGRKPNPDFSRRLQKSFNKARSHRIPFWEALEEPMAVAICSLDSLLLFEDRSNELGKVSGVELANRMSFALWRSAPDFELIRLGVSGELLKPEVHEAQLKRMMADDKFDRFVQDFTEQWFELDRQDMVAVNESIHRGFDFDVLPFMKQETVRFMEYLLEEDLPLTNVIDSDFVVINGPLAKHYGIKGVRGNEFQVIPRNDSPESIMRGGILTQAGILMQGSNGDRTSVIERGVFIARKLIDSPPADPPPNVDALPLTGEQLRNLTNVELTKAHANAPECSNCHARIDPLGVPLEIYDVVGLYREREKVLNPDFQSLSAKEQKIPKNAYFEAQIQSEGEYYTGEKFDGILGLKKGLMERKHLLGRGYIKALLSCINGRKADYTDSDTVNNILEEFAEDNYPVRSILEKVMLSEVLTDF